MSIRQVFSPAHLECAYPYFIGILLVAAFVTSGSIMGPDEFCSILCINKISDGMLMYSSIMSALLSSLFAIMFSSLGHSYMKEFQTTIQFARLRRFMVEAIIVNLLITIGAMCGLGFDIQSIGWDFGFGAFVVALFGISVSEIVRLVVIVNSCLK